MKILMVGLANHQHILNFAESLKAYNFVIDGFNTNPLYRKENQKIAYETYNKLYNVLRLKNKYFDLLLKLFFATIAFLKLNKKYDVVQFHYINLFVVPLEIVAKAKSSKISTFVWGSDFLRAGRFMRIYLGIAFKFADSVVCDSNDVLYELEKVYPKYKYKMKCEYFGSKIIDNMLSITNSMESKKSDKVTIMCGYNATPAQNHEQIIQSLIPFKDDVRLIFPMTYSGDEEYKKIIADLLTKEGFDFILLKSFLSDEEWVSYLLMTDIFVHMQKSDAFSSTLAENLLLGHVVLNAEWLDYKDLEVNDVYYIKVSFEKLSSLIDNILKNMDKYKALAKENRNKIIRLKSLKYTISHCWIPYYKELAM